MQSLFYKKIKKCTGLNACLTGCAMVESDPNQKIVYIKISVHQTTHIYTPTIPPTPLQFPHTLNYWFFSPHKLMEIENCTIRTNRAILDFSDNKRSGLNSTSKQKTKNSIHVPDQEPFRPLQPHITQYPTSSSCAFIGCYKLFTKLNIWKLEMALIFFYFLF